MTVAVIDYSGASDPLAAMMAAASARRARLYAPHREPETESVAPVVKPVVLSHVVFNDPVRDWIALATPAATKPGESTRIIALVAETFGVTRLDLISERRTADIVMPRQICFYLMRTCTTLSFPEIGRRMGGRDHTTAIHGVRKIAGLLETQPHIRVLVEALVLRIQAEAA